MRTGFRQVSSRNWALWVNGERMFVKGANLNPTRQALAEATAGELRGDVLLARDAGLDLVRLQAHVTRPELYDAAEADGAGIIAKVWHVTLPHLRGIMLITLILQIIGTSQVFLEPYLFTDGGPDNATLTVLLLVYNYAFANTTGGDYGKATALSLMLAGALAVLSIVYFRVTRRWSE